MTNTRVPNGSVASIPLAPTGSGTRAPAGSLAELLALAADYRAAVELRQRREEEERMSRERTDAESSARFHIQRYFPETLAVVLPQSAWRGYARGSESPLAPCAVAHLGEGLWLHHTRNKPFGSAQLLTLLVPCACGNYRHVALPDQFTLSEELGAVAANRGTCPGTCTTSAAMAFGGDW
ncbi:hypothetical protein ABT160_25920 [Streptomyces sp. NPDC001941]|uniref:hypothetical protein n=1 Tax=Streptomyces sp. NPDC001941 TaxID=3154659 RepID=UPI003328A902